MPGRMLIFLSPLYIIGLKFVPREYRALHSEFEYSAEYRPGTEYRALHSDVEYSAEYRPGEPNIELYIRSLNIVLNIGL